MKTQREVLIAVHTELRTIRALLCAIYRAMPDHNQALEDILNAEYEQAREDERRT